MAFSQLHLHTMFSLQDSTSKPEDIINKLKEIGQTSVAITDHGYLYGNVDFYKLCKKNNIKMIYGCEFYICDDVQVKDKDNKYNHLIVLAESDIGRININKLSSFGDIEGFYHKPRIDYKTLVEHREGLIVLSACMAGEIQQALLKDDKEKAISIARKYKNDFGNSYYLEIQSHEDIMQRSLNKQVIEIAKKLKIPFVVTTDAHYVNKEDQEFHSLFIQINQDREVGEIYTDCYIQSEDEIREKISYLESDNIDTAINNTILIAERCNVIVPLSAPIIPHADTPKEFNTEYEYLVKLCSDGWINRKVDYKLNVETYIKRLEYELDSVKRMGFEGYYLLVRDYVLQAKRKSPGRGSSGGSIIAWLIGITEIDPIKYGLYFERFIDVGALDLLEQGIIQPHELKIPDVDTDFGEEDRENILKYLTEKYGKDRVVSIGTFQFLKAKSAIKDMGRILGIPYEETNAMTSMLEGTETIEEALDEGIFDKYKDKYPRLFENAIKMAGLPKSFSTHASGKIIAQDDIYNYHAVYKNDDGIIVIQCDMKSAENLGLVKIDLLGLRTIDVIYDVLEMIGKDYGYIKIDKLDFDDKKVLDVFKNGLTTGIFQFESPGMKNTLRTVGIDSLEELAICNALYRPGAKSFIKNFAARKKGTETYEYLHKDLETILANSYAIIVFQEQLIDIGRLAHIKNPDDIRVATAKKKIEVMNKVKPELNTKLLERGWTQNQFDDLWEQIEAFAKYSFNRSHAVLYAVVAFQTAFLKCYHPKEYVCATLNSYKGKIKDIKNKLNLLYENKIKVEKFDFRKSFPYCKMEDSKFYYGVSLIKDCNTNMCLELEKVRNMKFDSFIDFLIYITENCSIDKTQMNVLINLNFFDEFGGNKKLSTIYNEFKTGKNKYSKTYVEKTKLKRIELLKEFEKSVSDEKLSLKEQFEYENENVGTICGRFDISKRYVYITNVQNQEGYAPRVEFYCLNNGAIESMKIPTRTFNNKLLSIGDIIYITEINEKPKKIFISQGNFKNSETEKEWWIDNYDIKNSEFV
jgi:DNA polymerase-3 subunit alpha